MSALTEATARRLIAALELHESRAIEREELRSLGHRIVYDKKTGRSLNIPGITVDPADLDARGYRIR